MIDWWKENGCYYLTLSSRTLIQMRGGCDIDRSFNFFTSMTRQPDSAAMTPSVFGATK